MLAGLLVLALTVADVVPSAQRLRERRAGSPLRGLYLVESFERDGVRDRDNPDAERWVRLGMTPPYAASIQRADGSVVRMRVDVDEEAGTVSFFERGGEPPEEPQFAYELAPDGVLSLRGRFEDGDLAVEARRQETRTLLESRRFHWINEYPFNR